VVDVDDSVEAATNRLVISVDRQRASALGISQNAVTAAISTAIGGEDVNYLHTGGAKYPVPIRLQLSDGEKAGIERVLALKLRARNGTLVAMSQIVSVIREPRETSIHHKDMLPVVYVSGDMAGPLDSPLYAMGEIYSRIDKNVGAEGRPIAQYLFSQPANPIETSIKWDGEWQITFETFRDMGIAYGVGMILIYFLIVAQFRSYLVPLII
ncbi:MAG: efflux RND transporter permease subunit, partial [bacterium]|nr:efflux RND transporter permease subunit [bacterium]